MACTFKKHNIQNILKYNILQNSSKKKRVYVLEIDLIKDQLTICTQ